MHTLGDLLQKRRGNLLVGGVLLEIDWDQKLLGLCVDIADVDTAFMCEEDPVALRGGRGSATCLG